MVGGCDRMDSPWIIAGPLSAVAAITTGETANPDTADSVMPLGAFAAHLEQLAARAADGAAMWRAGERMELTHLGAVGGAMAAAPTLGQALRCLVTYFGTVQSASSVAMEQEGDTVTLHYRVLDEDIWPRAADAELTLGVFAGAVRRFAPDAARAVAATLEADQNRSAAAISAHLGRAVRAGPDNALSIPARLLDQRAPAAAPDDGGAAFRASMQSLDRHLRQIRLNQPVSDRVLDLLLQRMGRAEADQDAIARALGMSRRTLRRRLEAEGQTFQHLNEICRCNIGRALLIRSELPMIEIALRLGYSDHTAFSRAFSRWFGMSPRDLRRNDASGRRVIT